MTPVPLPESSVSSMALTAFLHGVERRGFVLALLQCGDEVQAGQALAVTLNGFSDHAGEALMADWPIRFWGLLVATPGLRTAQLAPAGAPLHAALAAMSANDRLALLLRIVAGLDEPMASDVLGVGEDDYRLALARACPRDAAGQPDAAAWRMLAEAAQAQVRELSTQRLQRLTQLREARCADVPVTPPRSASVVTSMPASRPADRVRRRGSRRRGEVRALLVAVAVIGGVAILTWWWQRSPTLPPDPVSQALPGALHVVDAGPVLVEQLPADTGTSAPVARSGPDPADAAMLADPELGLARHADLYAWFAAGAPLPVDESEGRPSVSVQSDSAGLETIDDEN